ncbi:hypothetical protein IWQ55_004179 [Labrenzia sp. EL_208]|nr:hypothetical protein [Labrenzia sp. EL_195]MBG6176575.1 hypothetical protein [Labrenzia sp. EL_132]MBG6201961.1 hypothetical protein [Labrenzia sp. EL_13]MBG6230955.1 hypothetical protein [Labrenzia sp. EL_208]
MRKTPTTTRLRAQTRSRLNQDFDRNFKPSHRYPVTATNPPETIAISIRFDCASRYTKH